jgi:hypothetical protein
MTAEKSGKDGREGWDTTNSVMWACRNFPRYRDVALQIRANRGCHGVPLQTSALASTFLRVHTLIRKLQWYILENS